MARYRSKLILPTGKQNAGRAIPHVVHHQFVSINANGSHFTTFLFSSNLLVHTTQGVKSPFFVKKNQVFQNILEIVNFDFCV